jgi:WD40 repeat protein
VSAHDKDINAVAVSPNDAFVCTASQDRTAKVQQANFENVKPTSVGAA